MNGVDGSFDLGAGQFDVFAVLALVPDLDLPVQRAHDKVVAVLLRIGNATEDLLARLEPSIVPLLRGQLLVKRVPELDMVDSDGHEVLVVVFEAGSDDLLESTVHLTKQYPQLQIIHGHLIEAVQTTDH